MTDKITQEDALPQIRDLEGLIGKHLQDGEVVEAYTSKAGTAIGDNYGSTALGVEIILQNTKNGSSHTLSTFCKMIPRDEKTREIFNVDVSFVKELKMYLLAIPAMLQLQQENNVHEGDFITKITPKFYGGRMGEGETVDDDSVIILENLKEKNFGLADRRIGVDYAHARLVMQKLAVFHALPIALKLKKPKVFEETILEAGKFFEFGGELKAGGDAKFIDIIVKNMKKWPELQDLVEVVKTVCLDRIAQSFPPKGGDAFTTVMHNDLWVNNMLFFSSDGYPQEVVFIDFQVTQMDSPFKDVLFFLFTSVQTKERKAYLDELIEIYYFSFCNCLKQVGVDPTPFTLDAVWEEIRAIAHSELYHILSMLRFITADKEFIKEHPEEFPYHEDLGGQIFREKLRDVVLEYAERKWI